LFISLRRGTQSQNQTPPVRSIAVLPLKNLTDDPANEYFSDGMTESLITALSKIEGLKVISRGSVFRFKGREADPREVGKQLGVASVLEGSVRRDADSVRVVVRLVSVEDGRVLWAGDTYDRALGDIFALQDEVARSLAGGLRVKLSGEGERSLAHRYTGDVEAYELYLKGRFFWNKRSEEGLQKGVEYFEQAIARDPNYALAYAGLSDSYALLNLYGSAQQKDSFPRAKAAAEKALAIDETLAEAHNALAYLGYASPLEAMPQSKAAAQQALSIDNGLAEAHLSSASVLFLYDWDWPAADKEFRQAIELDPGHAMAYHGYGLFLAAKGRFDQALIALQQALAIDPVSPLISTSLALLYSYTGQIELGLAQCQEALEIDPEFGLTHLTIGNLYSQKRMYDAAIEAYQKTLHLLSHSPDSWSSLGHTYAISGDKAAAVKVINTIIELQPQHFSPMAVATVHAGLRDQQSTFEWLEAGYKGRATKLVYLNVNPFFAPFRAEPQFADLLERIGIKPRS